MTDAERKAEREGGEYKMEIHAPKMEYRHQVNGFVFVTDATGGAVINAPDLTREQKRDVADYIINLPSNNPIGVAAREFIEGKPDRLYAIFLPNRDCEKSFKAISSVLRERATVDVRLEEVLV